MSRYLMAYLVGAVGTCLIYAKVILFTYINGQTIINSDGVERDKWLVACTPIVMGIVWPYGLPLLAYHLIKNW